MSASRFKALTAADNVGYGTQPIPAPRDYEILNLLTGVGVAAFDGLSPEHANTLTAFAERAASWAVRTGDVLLVKAGLYAVGRSLSVCDKRDALIAMSLLYRACEKSGIDARRAFSESAFGLGPTAQEFVDEFLKRSQRDKSIEAMGFSESMDSDGFRFRCDWP